MLCVRGGCSGYLTKSHNILCCPSRRLQAGLHPWGTAPVERLKSSALEWSTVIEADARAKNRGKDKTCLFCGKKYSGGPDKIRIHLDANVKPREVATCKPLPEWRERHRVVLAEMRERAAVGAARKQKAIEVEEQRDQRRAAGGAGPEGAAAAAAAKLFDIKTVDDVTLAWLKVVVKKALPLDIFDDGTFRAAVATTARCGTKLTCGAKGNVHLRSIAIA